MSKACLFCYGTGGAIGSGYEDINGEPCHSGPYEVPPAYPLKVKPDELGPLGKLVGKGEGFSQDELGYRDFGECGFCSFCNNCGAS